MKTLITALALLTSISSFASSIFPSSDGKYSIVTLDEKPIIVAEAIDAQELSRESLDGRALVAAQIFCDLKIPGSFAENVSYAYRSILEKDINVYDKNSVGWILEFYENGTVKKDLQYLRQGYMEEIISDTTRSSYPVAPALLKSVKCTKPTVKREDSVINH